ncbi:MAG: hypothetical protein AAFV27_07560, partial [Pseudomonadota bacterium]
MTGQLIAVVGPSGAGKDTVLDAICAARPTFRRVRRVITRPSSAGGEAFDGVTRAEFARRAAMGQAGSAGLRPLPPPPPPRG